MLRNSAAGGEYWVLFLFVLIWCADSAAYFAGRSWGRHKLAAMVSPGKTLEGLGGALAAALVLVLVAAFAAPLVDRDGLVIGLAVLALVTVLMSVLGDLAESLFKRLAGVKDSGSILPGHGGILDRIDSLTAAVPTFVAGLWWLGVVK
ncbi:MAG: phosphatidate cytidylyltransferase [Gammaproteobacteria bacterium]|nr:phosphatidate cytidylyltransferase [Gammaproteobacteria bacterium]